MVGRSYNKYTKSAGPTPIFKKRNVFFDTTLTAGTTGQVIASVTVNETGTIYAAKVCLSAILVGGTTADATQMDVFVYKTRAGGATPNLNSLAQRDTLEGFLVGTFLNARRDALDFKQTETMNEKFRFRRMVDAQDLIVMAAQLRQVGVTNRDVRCMGSLAYVIRVR